MRQDASEHGKIFFKGEMLFRFRECCGAIGERNNAEALLVTRARCRLDTAVRQEAGDHQSLDPARAKDEVEIRAGKGVKPALSFDDNVR